MSDISLIKRAILQNHFVNTWYNPGRYRSTKQQQVTTPEHPKTYSGVLWTLFSTLSLTLTFTRQNHCGSHHFMWDSFPNCGIHIDFAQWERVFLALLKHIYNISTMPLLLLHFYYLSAVFYDSILPPRLAEVRREPTKLCHWGLCMQGKKDCRKREKVQVPHPLLGFCFPSPVAALFLTLDANCHNKGIFFFLSKILLVEVLQSTPCMKTDDVTATSHIRGTREHKNTMMATPGSMQ